MSALSKRRLESYRRAEVVAQAAREFITAPVSAQVEKINTLSATVLDWMTVTGKQKYDPPIRRGRHR
jgi:hypothetical protein